MMKKYIYQMLCSLFIGGAMVSCAEDYMETDKGHDTLTLTVNQQEIVLNEKNHTQEALTLSWTTGTNYGSGNRISYTLEIAKAGTDFARAYSVDLGTGTYQWTKKTEELNQFLNTQLGVGYAEKVSLEARITATVAGMEEKEQRATVALDVTTYQPVTPTLYLIGEAAPNGWSADQATPMERTDNGQFTWTGKLNTGVFKFITTLGEFLPSYNRDAAAGEELRLIYRTSGDEPDEPFTVSKEAMINFLRTSSDFFLQDEVLKKDFLKRLELSVKLSQLAGAQMEGQDFPTAQEMQEQTYEEARTEIDGMIAFLDSSLNDVSMTVYVDKEGCLASVKGTTSFNSTGSEAEPVQLQFGCELKGGAYPTQNMSAQAVLENGAASVQIEAVKEGAYDGKELTSGFELSIENQGEIAEKWDITLDSSYNSEGGGFDVQAAAAQDGMELLGFSAQGVVDELEKGKNIHLTLDSLDVSAMGDTGNAVLSGEYYIRPLTEEVVPLEGDTMDVLAAGEEEWNSVLMEVLFSFISLSGQMDTGN